MKYALALVVAFALTGAAVAQQNHEAQKGPNGGMMDDVAGVHAELVTSGTTITISAANEIFTARMPRSLASRTSSIESAESWLCGLKISRITPPSPPARPWSCSPRSWVCPCPA